MSIEGAYSTAIVTITITGGVPVGVQTGSSQMSPGTYKIVVSEESESLSQVPVRTTAPPPGIILNVIAPTGAVSSDLKSYRTMRQVGGLQAVVGGSVVCTQLGPRNLKDGVYTIQELLTNIGRQLLATTPVYGEVAGFLDL